MIAVKMRQEDGVYRIVLDALLSQGD